MTELANKYPRRIGLILNLRNTRRVLVVNCPVNVIESLVEVLTYSMGANGVVNFGNIEHRIIIPYKTIESVEIFDADVIFPKQSDFDAVITAG